MVRPDYGAFTSDIPDVVLEDMAEDAAAEAAYSEWDARNDSLIEPPLDDQELEHAEVTAIRNQCPLCGKEWALWFGQMPARCTGCGQVPAKGVSR